MMIATPGTISGSFLALAENALPHEPLPDFDLSYVRARVAREHSDWDEQRLTAAELDYRLYLARCKAPHDGPLSPGRDADEFWHAHILHTKEYANDCQAYFGRFLHHRPLVKADCFDDPCNDDRNECECDTIKAKCCNN